jgi:hypothetical protein
MSLDSQRYEKNLRDEFDGSALYAAVAAAETDPVFGGSANRDRRGCRCRDL